MDFSLIGLWSQMGFIARAVVIILLGMSMFAVGIAAERFITFRRSKERSLAYVANLARGIDDLPVLVGKAELSPEFEQAPLARVCGTGLKEFRQGMTELADAAADAVEMELLMHGVARAMDRAKKREMADLSRGLPVLATIASSAPFVGLFGTVFGIITAFRLMADPEAGGGGLATVSAGIAEALLTTAVGLGVAIVAVWLYNFFTTKLEELGGIIDDASGELVDRLSHGTRRLLVSGTNLAQALANNSSVPAPAVSAPHGHMARTSSRPNKEPGTPPAIP